MQLFIQRAANRCFAKVAERFLFSQTSRSTCSCSSEEYCLAKGHAAKLVLHSAMESFADANEGRIESREKAESIRVFHDPVLISSFARSIYHGFQFWPFTWYSQDSQPFVHEDCNAMNTLPTEWVTNAASPFSSPLTSSEGGFPRTRSHQTAA